MKDGDLWAKAIDDDGDEMTFRLYPIGENEFGRKGGLLKLIFGDGCLSFDDITTESNDEGVLVKTAFFTQKGAATPCGWLLRL